MNLKKKLAIFDFDNTIKQHAPGFSTGGGMAEFFPDKKIPVEIFQVWKDQGFDAFCSTLISETNKLNVSREVLVKAVESDGELIKGIDVLFKALHKEYDIIILSAGYDDMIKLFLARHGLLNLVYKVFATPTTIASDGQMIIKPIPKEWGGPCKSEGGQICKVSVLKYFTKNHQYERLIYVGDGPNDVCPALILNANDLVCPRQGLKMESLLQQYCIQAQIVSWKDGTDILKYI